MDVRYRGRQYVVQGNKIYDADWNPVEDVDLEFTIMKIAHIKIKREHEEAKKLGKFRNRRSG